MDNGLASTSELEAWAMEVELEPAKEEGLEDISGARSRLNISTTKVEMGMEARWLDTEEGGEEVTTASMDRCGLGVVETDEEGQSSLIRPIWLLGEEMEVLTREVASCLRCLAGLLVRTDVIQTGLDGPKAV